MTKVPPLVLDVDGTLTRPGGRGLDPRVFDPLASWEAPIVVATGKAIPYPVALCHFIGIPERVIAENGGVVLTADSLEVVGDREAAQQVLDAYEAAGYSAGWRGVDTVNRWRETELAISRDQPLEPLERLADDAGLSVVDTGYAYHLTHPTCTKGASLERFASAFGVTLSSCVAIGDSENDVSTFERVGRSFAVANADDAAKDAADEVLSGAHADGTLAALDRLRP
ncbi:HAD-IIB family hydrolase [Halovivax gelatinilyticus]|uniref:HAD-IIB family hydrolase n=1 Tax=Halovivax gelatinilyticus TaxID=2961597 RepID=UPI0020CA52CC|nr:HAD-IIB family hydrolase [Halovivax gelatinilyticus]